MESDKANMEEIVGGAENISNLNGRSCTFCLEEMTHLLPVATI